ncbi:pilus assembly protein CpaA [Brevibacillus parabrevis]|uniref:A24 family peptidase n=1 Tax=Brevibacillus parabrevis TaxID=54914 RepID=UPI0007ABEA08|nr:A24 family peptidase [Brevibacillus parabrevis]KZE53564.1 pilus assembly protein CpaA [Brevibacillus parabrevis]
MIHVILTGLLVTSAWYDWKYRRIPNAVTLSAVVLGLCYHWHIGSLWTAAMGVLGAFVLTVFPVAAKGMGMGDQKLLMALGAWTSWMDVYTLFLQSMGICLLSVLFFPRSWSRLARNLHVMAAGWKAHRQIWLPEVKSSGFSFPYAVFLLCAFLLRQAMSILGES